MPMVAIRSSLYSTPLKRILVTADRARLGRAPERFWPLLSSKPAGLADEALNDPVPHPLPCLRHGPLCVGQLRDDVAAKLQAGLDAAPDKALSQVQLAQALGRQAQQESLLALQEAHEGRALAPLLCKPALRLVHGWESIKKFTCIFRIGL